MNALKGKKAVYYTLGCKLNFAETSSIQHELEQLGMSTARAGEEADLVLVNTCTVTAVADSKSRGAISRLHHRHPEALIVVTGCYDASQKTTTGEGDGRTGDAPAIFVDAKHKGDIVRLVAEKMKSEDGGEKETNPDSSPSTPHASTERSFFPACACGERTRYFLKVQDGCDYFCTYCTIPFSRGRSRNGSIASLVGQAEEAARRGAKEIVLTGVNTGDFGKTTDERFIDLVRALDSVEGIHRYRISSIEPNLLTEDIIRFVSESRAFMPHFHIPLQSGSDEVLRLMHRRYDTKAFREKIEQVRRYLPDAFIGVDVIVGMRGETDELFHESYQFMRELPVSQYHVFSYSERPGTKALSIPHKVSPQEKHERSQRVLALSDEKLHTYYNIYKGQVRPVLLEHNTKGASSKEQGARSLNGFTDNYIRTQVDNFTISQIDNLIAQVRLGDWNEKGDALKGEIVRMGE